MNVRISVLSKCCLMTYRSSRSCLLTAAQSSGSGICTGQLPNVFTISLMYWLSSPMGLGGIGTNMAAVFNGLTLLLLLCLQFLHCSSGKLKENKWNLHAAASCSYHRPGAQIKAFSSVGCAHLGAHLPFHSSIPHCHFHLLTLQKSLNTLFLPAGLL